MASEVGAILETVESHNASARRRPPLPLLEGHWTISGAYRPCGDGEWISASGTARGRLIMNDQPPSAPPTLSRQIVGAVILVAIELFIILYPKFNPPEKNEAPAVETNRPTAVVTEYEAPPQP